MARTWKRQEAGHYVSNDGWVIEQAQGTRYPNWFIYKPGQDTILEHPWSWTPTLREAKKEVEDEERNR